MIEKYRLMLNDVRNGRIPVSEFLYIEEKDENGYRYDAAAIKRFQLLKALQFYRIDADEKLLVELFKAEIERHQKAPFQGIYAALSLNAFMVSEFLRPEYWHHFINAKQANFDTHCGFDYQFLISAGIKETFTVVRDDDSKMSEAFYNYVGKSPKECFISEQERTQWLEYKKNEFPRELLLDSIEAEIDLAIDLDEKEVLKEKIEVWRDSITTWTTLELNRLSYYKMLVNDTDGEIWANEELLKLASSDWDKASALQNIAELHLVKGDLSVAWDKIKQTHPHLAKISDWKNVGLGRFIMEIALDVVLTTGEGQNEMKKEAYTWASREVVGAHNLHLNLIEKVTKAADLMGDSKLREKFDRLYKVEKEKLDQVLNGN